MLDDAIREDAARDITDYYKNEVVRYKSLLEEYNASILALPKQRRVIFDEITVRLNAELEGRYFRERRSIIDRIFPY